MPETGAQCGEFYAWLTAQGIGDTWDDVTGWF